MSSPVGTIHTIIIPQALLPLLPHLMDWDRRVRLTEEITGLRYVWGKDEP